MRKLSYLLALVLLTLMSSCLSDNDASPRYWYLLSPVESVAIVDSTSGNDTIFVTHFGHTSCDVYYTTISTVTDSGTVLSLYVASPENNEDCDIELTPMEAKFLINDYDSGTTQYFYFWTGVNEDTDESIYLKDSVYIK